MTGYALLALSYCKPADEKISMDLFDAIANRYSYRGEFTDAPVPRKDLGEDRSGGHSSPVGLQRAGRVVRDRRRSRVARADRRDRGQAGLPLGQGDDRLRGRSAAGVRRLSFAAEDCAAAVENMLWPSPPWAMPASGSTACCVRERPPASAGFSAFRPVGSVRILLPIGVPAEPGVQREKLPFDSGRGSIATAAR